MEFTFKGIGVLVIRGNKVKMRFYKDFLCTMDGTGALAKALANVNYVFLLQTPLPSIALNYCVSLLREIQVEVHLGGLVG